MTLSKSGGLEDIFPLKNAQILRIYFFLGGLLRKMLQGVRDYS
jgi:hypothetical protein